MNFEEKHIAQFDAYNQGEMNQTEKQFFEQRLANEPDFKSSYESFNELEGELEKAAVASFKDNLKNWDEPIKETANKGKVINMRYIALVAAIAVIGFLAVNYFSTGTSNQELATNYFTPYENIITIRGAQESLDDAMVLYESGEYEKAHLIFDKYPQEEAAIFYAGESFMALKSYSKAIARYKILTSKNGIFQEIATYHLGLAYLGSDNLTEALSTLEGISKSSDYYQDAQLLLKDLK